MSAPTLQISSDQLAEAPWSKLPRGYGVYAIYDGPSVVHLSWSVDLPRRLYRLLQSRGRAGETLREQLIRGGLTVQCWSTGSSLENAICLYQLARLAFPGEYRKRLRLRTPWFVGLTNDPFPYLSVTGKLDRISESMIGPFPNREMALRYEESAAGLFQLRRCTDLLDPNPDHPGCIYGEMALCSRPCQAHVSAEEYASETERVREFLAAAPESTVTSIVQARDTAAAQLEFEAASAIHRRLEKVQTALQARHEAARPIADLNGIAVNPDTEENVAVLRAMRRGIWQEAARFALGRDDSRSLDHRLREALEWDADGAEAGSIADHLAIFMRWHGSVSRTGLWFPVGRNEPMPYRKLARGLAKLFSA